jgi:hypothetical protein
MKQTDSSGKRAWAMMIPSQIKKHLRTKASGLLSIRLEGESHLLKIYIEKGEIVSLSLGTYKNEDCLDKLDGVVPIEHFFVRGAKSPIISSIPLTEKLTELSWMANSETNVKISSSHGVSIQPQIIASLEEEFIGIIGPIGRIFVDNIFSEISYSRGKPMSSEDYSYFLENIIKELPVNQQASFSEKYKKE